MTPTFKNKYLTQSSTFQTILTNMTGLYSHTLWYFEDRGSVSRGTCTCVH